MSSVWHHHGHFLMQKEGFFFGELGKRRGMRSNRGSVIRDRAATSDRFLNTKLTILYTGSEVQVRTH